MPSSSGVDGLGDEGGRAEILSLQTAKAKCEEGGRTNRFLWGTGGGKAERGTLSKWSMGNKPSGKPQLITG